MRDIEAHEFRGALRDAEHIAWSKDDVLVQGPARKCSGILALRQSAPEIKAAARHEPGLDAEGIEPCCGFAARPREPPAQFVHMLAVAAAREAQRDARFRSLVDGPGIEHLDGSGGVGARRAGRVDPIEALRA